MEKEVSYTVWLAVSMMAIAIVITIAWFTIGIGNDAKNFYAEEAMSMASDLESGELNDLRSTCKNLPMAAIYNLLVRNNKSIVELEIYNVKLATNKPDAISKFLDDCDNPSTAAISGAVVSTFKLNNRGSWTRNGVDADGALACYEVMTNNNMLVGRGYIVSHKLKTGMYKVKILWY